METGINYLPWLLFHPLSQKPCLCKPSCSIPRVQDASTQDSSILPAEVLCLSRSQAWWAQASLLPWGKTAGGKPCTGLARELQAAAWINPRLFISSLSCSSTLLWAAGQKLQDCHSPLPKRAKGNSEDSWSGHALFPRRGIKCALTKVVLPAFFLGDWGRHEMEPEMSTLHS